MPSKPIENSTKENTSQLGKLAIADRWFVTKNSVVSRL